MGIIEKYKDGILYYQIEGFEFENRFNHIFSTRIGWRQENIFGDLAKVLDIPEEKIYRAKQVHGTDILIIKDQDYNSISIEEKDGFVTNIKNIALATYHADCVPIYFHDRKEKVIGLAHAGWKGTLNNISKSVIENMIEHFDSKVEDIIVAIGPSIGVCCYEIGNDVEKLFLEKYTSERDMIIDKNNKIYLDLWKVNETNLLKLGIKKENICHSNICTSCRTDKLFSYRKEKGTKNRMIAAIRLN